MKQCIHKKAFFFLPVNILTVLCAGFLGCMTHYIVCVDSRSPQKICTVLQLGYYQCWASYFVKVSGYILHITRN